LLATNEPVSSQAHEQILGAARAIGTVGGSSGTISALLAVLYSDDADPYRISELISCEPGLTARVLKVANSSYYGLSRSVSSVERAVLVLGLDAVRGIAASACLERAMPRADAAGIDPAPLLEHSIAVAAASQSIAKLCRPQLANDVFIAAVLHDLGAVLQNRANPHGLQKFLAGEGGATLDRGLREMQLVGFTHEHAAAVAFESWSLPESLTLPVLHHHAPLAAPASCRDQACILNLADHLAARIGLDPLKEWNVDAWPEPVIAALGLTVAALEPILAALPDQAAGLSNAFDD